MLLLILMIYDINNHITHTADSASWGRVKHNLGQQLANFSTEFLLLHPKTIFQCNRAHTHSASPVVFECQERVGSMVPTGRGG